MWRCINLEDMRLRANSHGVPSPKSQVSPMLASPTFLASRNHWIYGLLMNTIPTPYLQKVLPRRHPCHTWDLGLGTWCIVISPKFHALNGWDYTDWPQVTWDHMRTNAKSNNWLFNCWNHSWGKSHTWVDPNEFTTYRSSQAINDQAVFFIG